MERLTDKDTNHVCFDTWELCGLDRECKRDCWKPTPCKIPKIIWKLADLEDAEEQGLLIRLPRKVGDTVYVICKGRFINTGKFRVSDYDSIGKTVFYTRKEAEEALKNG